VRASFITQGLRMKDTKLFFVSLAKYIIIWFIRACRLSSFRRAHMPYNKKLTGFDSSGCMGKYQNSVLLY
jgi:hypothetical protein